MEQKEQEMLTSLKTTQMKQRQVYSSLEQMVKVGYNYYNQCYDLKMQKQSMLYPRIQRRS